MDGSDEGMRLSPTKARFQPEDRGATFDACHTLCDVFDEKFEVFGGVCASEKTDGILIVGVRSLAEHLPEIGGEDRIG
jgi:hypothetical protein